MDLCMLTSFVQDSCIKQKTKQDAKHGIVKNKIFADERVVFSQYTPYLTLKQSTLLVIFLMAVSL